MAQSCLPRTQASVIRGVPVGQSTTTNPKYIWTKAEEFTFAQHVRAHPAPENRFDDLPALLEQLDLHGYGDDVLNTDGRPVGAIILTKVKAKINQMREKMASGYAPPAPRPDANGALGGALLPGFTIDVMR
ncbi:hypothetical protein F4802DRAFT_547408 [Xylaria palmicola]|nr:hypothetical protein F4802DRAFT_547408 [Xylaria palmicola]